jgi:VWFA-related protein
LSKKKASNMKIALSRKAATCAAIVVAFTSLGLLRAIPKDKDDVPDVKFTLRTELVLIPTVVTDKSGNHITGLKREDFTVLENGSEQEITTFEEVSSTPNRFLRPDVPNEFSNSVAADPSSRRITLIMLDLINTRFADQATAREDLLKYLTQSVDVREPTALYTLDRTGIHVIHDFTTDPRILVAALHEVNGDPDQLVDSPSDSADSAAGGSPGGGGGSHGSGGGHISKGSVHKEASNLQSMMHDAEGNFRSFEQRLAIQYTLEAMQQVAQALGGYPGRKSLIWASGGFPFTVSGSMGIAPAGRETLADVLPMYERTWDLLNNAQISLYPVDVKGLRVVGMPSAATSGGSSMRNPSHSFSHASSRQMDTQATFQTFASMTGGRAYYNSNDLVKGFRDAVNDSSEYYMLGYYLDHSNTKSGWRKLSVKVNRDHIEVRARDGFFVTNATVDPETTRNSDISSALQSPLDYTSLSLLAHWTKTEPAQEPGKRRAIYQIHVSPDARVINEADNNHVVLDFVAQAIASDGKAASQPVGQKVDVHLTSDKLKAIRDQGVLYNGALELPPGEYTVRFVVRDDLSGRTGSVSGPLKVD